MIRYYPQYKNAKVLFTVRRVPYFLVLAKAKGELAVIAERALRKWVNDGRWAAEAARIAERKASR